MLDRPINVLYLPQEFLIGALIVREADLLIPWNATTGSVYQVQYTTNFSSPVWLDLGAPVTSQGCTAALCDPAPIGLERFYRVLSAH